MTIKKFKRIKSLFDNEIYEGTVTLDGITQTVAYNATKHFISAPFGYKLTPQQQTRLQLELPALFDEQIKIAETEAGKSL